MSLLPGRCEYENCESPVEGRTTFCATHNQILRSIARDLNRPVKPVKPLRRVPVQKISEKQVNITSELNKVYDAMDRQERDANGGYFQCAAYPELCSANATIDHSHTISRKRCKELGMPELIYDPGNIEFCSRMSHDEWDTYSPRMLKHANFQKRMDYIKQYDPHDYDRRMEVWAAANPVKDKTI